MTNDAPIYETPALVEIGEFTELTLGNGPVPVTDSTPFGVWF